MAGRPRLRSGFAVFVLVGKQAIVCTESNIKTANRQSEGLRQPES